MFKLALASLALSSIVSHAAEVRVLENFNPATKKYTGTISSTTEVPGSLAPLLNVANGVCYKGEIPEVADLLNVMAAVYNAEQSEVIVNNVAVTAVEVQPRGTIALKLEYKSKAQTGTWEWTKIPYCVR